MKKVFLAAAAVAMLAGCTTAEQTGVAGAATGATIGDIATGTGTSALAGAAIGGATGYVVGRAIDNRPGYCQDVDTRTGRAIGSPYPC